MGGIAHGIGSVIGGVLGNVSNGLSSGLGKGGNQGALMNLLNDETGKPTYPGFTSMVDPTTGFLDPKYQVSNNLNTQALDKLQAQALSDTPSQWAQLTEAAQKDQAASAGQGATADAQSRLAMRGGLSSGAQERIAQSGANNELQAQQQIGQNVALQDEQNKQAALAALPGLQQQAAQYGQNTQEYNIGNVLAQNKAQQDANLAKYQADMQAYAAKKSGLATLYGGGKKG